MSDSESFVLNQLHSLPAKYKLDVRRGTAWICCPFHRGNGIDGLEVTPSMQIRTVPGKYPVGSARCHACSKTFKTWNDLADELQLKQTVGYDEETFDVLSQEDRDYMLGVEQFTGLSLRSMDEWPEDRDWRGIRGEVVKAVGGMVYWSDVSQKNQLYLPCMVLGNHVGGIKCLINPKKHDKRKYFNTKGTWTKTGLYGYDYVQRMIERLKLKTALIVEGPRDTLNMVQHGIPAFGLLGSGQWSPQKKQLILGLDIENIIIATDPDPAGDKVAKIINEDLRQELNVKRFRLDASIKEDPGNMKPKRIKQLAKYIV